MENTKKSLIASGLSIILCIALLIGVTFAWFTDSVTNKGNVITAGNLSITATAYDVDMTSGDKTFTIPGINGDQAIKFEATGQDLKAANCPPIINETLWEPGKSNAKLLEVSNGGNLAAKIKLQFDVTDGGLMNALWFDFVQVDDSGNVTGTFTKRPMSELATFAQNMELSLAANGGNVRFILVYGMEESAGNEYMDKSFSADVTIVATQDTVETDGFGNTDYDAAAEYAVNVSNADDLADAIAAGKPVSLTNNIVLDEYLSAQGDVTIFGNGKTITSAESRVLDISNLTQEATITLVGVDLEGPTTGTYTRGISLYNNAEPVRLVLDNCSVSANYYALNVASANTELELTVKNSTITGWCAFQTHSPNAKITFENCTLLGINDKGYNADGWNNFATIVINGYTDGNPDTGGAHDCTLTFKDCRIEAQQTTGNRQLLLSVRAVNTTVNVENCTFYNDGVQIPSNLEAVAPYIGVTSQEIADSLTVNFK